MSQHAYITALNIPLPARGDLPEDMQKYFAKCDQKLGMLPNVLAAYSHNVDQLRTFSQFYNTLMLGESGLSKLEREMIAVAVSAANQCFYCQVAHGASVREYSGDPQLGELMVMNYRAADLSPRQRAMLDFAIKMTTASYSIGDLDREALREVGFSDNDIWDIANVAGFYNMTNRVASAVNMQPNPEYHSLHR